jgi:hypothetical protein
VDNSQIASRRSYDFRKDFDSIVRPGLLRYLDTSAEVLGAVFDDERRGDYAKGYTLDLRRALKAAQSDADLVRAWKAAPASDVDIAEIDAAAQANASLDLWAAEVGDAEHGGPWSAARAAEIAAEFEANAIAAERDGAHAKPVDVDRAVRLGTELARKQGLDVGPDAVAYATDGLRSKIERDAVHNPVTAVYSAFMSHAFLKKQSGGRNVLYCDRHRAFEKTVPEAERADNVVDFPAPKVEPKA